MKRAWVAFALLACCDRPATVSPTPTSTSTPTSTPTPTPTSTPTPTPTSIRLLFVGDLALALDVHANLARIAAHDPAGARLPVGYPFQHVREAIAGADLAVGNLECVASSAGKPSADHVVLQCPLAPAALKAVGFDLLGVANNHALDFGKEGFTAELAELERAGLAHFGREAHDHGPQRPWTTTLRGVRFGLLAYHEGPFSVRDVAAARAGVDVLAVFNHWGHENDTSVLALQRRFAHELIDAGADLVVGTHAHVLQDTERYRGKLIAYGLGNFVFSGMTAYEPNRLGAMLAIEVDPARRALAARLQRTKLDADGAPHLEGPAEPLP